MDSKNEDFFIGDLMNYLIALSGGLDSVVLLHLFHKQHQAGSIRAIHIHHGLHAEADDWAARCAELCTQWQIPLMVEQVTIDKLQGIGLEAAARTARYEAFTRYLQPDEVLVTAHHQNDQAETFLLHALRGAGPQGLSAMPVLKKISSSYHWRPLLHLNRAQLLDYANCHNLTWIHDDSNDNIAFDRNFLRHEIMPKLATRWPQAVNNFARTAEIQAELSTLLDDLLAPSWLLIDAIIPTLAIHPHYQQEIILPLIVLNKLPKALQAWLMRGWIKKTIGHTVSRKKLSLIIDEVIRAEQDRQPQLKIGNHLLYRYADALWLSAVKTPEMKNAAVAQTLQFVCENTRFTENQLQVRYRQGGERLRLCEQTQTLKNLFQVWRIPPWERSHVPLVYDKEQLIAIGMIYIIQGLR